MTYNKEIFTWGCEIEWGDIRRDVEIPEELGTWEYCETDVVNIRDPYKFVACDPLGIDPPVGGEINTKPTRTIDQQLVNIDKLIHIFEKEECPPTDGCTNELHIHVHVPGLKDDIDALKRLTQYIKNNQEFTMFECSAFEDHPTMKGLKGAKAFMKLDGARLMPDWMADNIINMAENFDDFIRLQCCGKDGVSRGRPFRYGINTYCMKHIETIEFRCFRPTVDIDEFESCFRFCEEFMYNALNGGKSVREIIEDGDYEFPPFQWDPAAYKGWMETKWPKERGTKERVFYEV